jgi:hypothetical protein
MVQMSMRIQPAIKVWQLANRLESLADLIFFFAEMPNTLPRIQQEVIKALSESHTRYFQITVDDILFTLQYVLIENGFDFATKIVTYHAARVAQAFTTLGKSRHHHFVIYLPTIVATSKNGFTRDKVLSKIPGMAIAGFPVSISFGGRGGRLWGFGFAKDPKERTNKQNSYQLLRVDYHRLHMRDNKHQLPFSDFIQQKSHTLRYHWHIPGSSFEARGNLDKE